MNIRPATKEDFPILYELGKSTIEFRVSAKEVFMDAEEFLFGIEDPHSVLLVAEENDNIIGFIYASEIDYYKSLENRSACLIYLTVIPEFRMHGVAQKLYQECEKVLKSRGISGIYGWANIESDGAIVKFMEKQGFLKGHKYVWMDKKI